MVFNLGGDAYVLIINMKARYKSIGKYNFFMYKHIFEKWLP